MMELLITFTHNSFCQKHQFLTKRHFFQHERSSVSDGLQLFSTIGKFLRVYLTTPHDSVTFYNRNMHFYCKWSIVYYILFPPSLNDLREVTKAPSINVKSSILTRKRKKELADAKLGIHSRLRGSGETTKK